MEELLKMLEALTKDGNVKVEVHKMDKEDFKKVFEKTEESKDADEMAEIAHLNRMLYEAHIKEGFTSEEAFALTVAVIQ